MESIYSVGTTNRYALFIGDEDDPGDITVPVTNRLDKSEKEKKKAEKQAPKGKGKENKDKGQKAQQQAGKKVTVESSNKQAERPANRQRSGKQENRRPPGGGEFRGGGDFRGERDERPPRGGRGGRPRLSSRDKDRDTEGGGFGGGFGGDREDAQSPRGRSRPLRGGRGGGGFRGGKRGGKREFERRSGSDKSLVKPVEKREGGGAHNWGRQDDLETGDDWPAEETQPEPRTESIPNGEPSEEQKGEKQEEEETPAGEPQSPVEESLVEEQPREMTLDEYKALKYKPTVKPETHERRAGENVDLTPWKNTIVLSKEDEEFFPGTREVIEKPKTSGRVKQTLDSNFFFRDPARRGGRGRTPGGGRGGRGGGFERRGEERRSEGGFERRGGGGGGGGFERRGEGEGRRYNRERRDKAPNVGDERDFPALGPTVQTA